MAVIRVWEAMSRVQRYAAIVLCCLSLYALLGFLAVPALLKQQAEVRLSQMLNRDVSVQGVNFNPFLFILEVDGLKIANKDPLDQQALMQWQHLHVDFELSSVFHWAWSFKEIRWHSPEIYIVEGEDKRFSFQDIIDNLSTDNDVEEVKPDAGTSQGATLPAIRIEKFVLSNAAFRFRDKGRVGEPLLELAPIGFTVDDFSTRSQAGEHNGYNLHIVGQNGGELSWKGAFQLQPFSSQGQLRFDNINLGQFVNFYQDQLGFSLPTALLSFSTDYQLNQLPDWGVELKNGTYTLSQFKVFDRDSQMLLADVPELSITGVAVNSRSREAIINKVALINALVQLQRQQDGAGNFDRALDFSAFTSEEDIDPEDASDKPAASSSSWYWRIDKLLVDNFTANIEDLSPEESSTVNVTAVAIELDDLHSDARSNFEVKASAVINQTGAVKVDGQGVLSPLMLDANAKVKALPLTFLQPYINQQAKVGLRRGELNADLHVQLQQSPEAEANDWSSLTVTGATSLDHLLLHENISHKKLLAWESLAFSGIDLDLVAKRLNVELLDIRAPFFATSLLPDGSSNLSHLLLAQDTRESEVKTSSNLEEPSSSEDFAFALATLNIHNGKLKFEDNTVTPNFVTSLDALSGHLKGVSNIAGNSAKILLKSKVNGYAPLEISGRSNFMVDQPVMDVTMLFDAIEMTSFSPYSSTYAGYNIQRGQISLDLRYSLKDDHLIGANGIALNQFDFGEKVISDKATALPVKLAVSLLEDSNNQINLDMNIEGDVNDPDFSVKGLVWKVLSNIITKAVTSPFSLLAGLVDSDEELNVLDFEYGQAELNAAAVEKLSSLAEALAARPKLNLGISGFVDQEADRLALAESMLQRQIQGYMQKRGWKKDAQGQLYQLPLALEDDRVATAIAKLFDAAEDQIDKQTIKDLDAKHKSLRETLDKLQFARQVTKDHYNLLVGLQQVDEQSLLNLASLRSQRVKAVLVEQMLVASQRLFIERANLDVATANAQVVMSLQ